MMDLLHQFLNSNPQHQQDYSDFLQRHQEDPSSISNEEAARRYRELMKNAPQDLADQANQHAFGQASPQERQDLANKFQDATKNPAHPFDGYTYSDPQQGADPKNLGRMTQQADNQDPDLFGQIFGSNSPLNSPVGKAALAAGAAYLASRVLSGQGLSGTGSQSQGSSGLGGLGNLLGGLTGGGSSNSGSAGGFGGSQTQQEPDIPGVQIKDSGFDKQV